jgi:hypothetical protein
MVVVLSFLVVAADSLSLAKSKSLAAACFSKTPQIAKLSIRACGPQNLTSRQSKMAHSQGHPWIALIRLSAPFAVKRGFESEPPRTPHAGFCSFGRCPCYRRHYDTAIEGGIGAASI